MTPSDPPAINPSRLLDTLKRNAAFLLGARTASNQTWKTHASVFLAEIDCVSSPRGPTGGA